VPHRHFCIPNIWLLLCVAIRHRICVGTGARGNGAQMQEHLAMSKCRDLALIDMSEADGDIKFNPRSSELKEVDVRGRDTRRLQAGGVHQQTDRTTRGRAKQGSPNLTCVNNGDRSSGFFSVTTPMTTSRSGRENKPRRTDHQKTEVHCSKPSPASRSAKRYNQVKRKSLDSVVVV
jgi:hypothetical protein